MVAMCARHAVHLEQIGQARVGQRTAIWHTPDTKYKRTDIINYYLLL